VNTIEQWSFKCSPVSSFQIAEGHRHFRVVGDFLLSFDGTSLIRYFGEDSFVQIPREIEVISKGAFERRASLSSIGFEADSRLRRIASGAFSSCYSLHSICLPCSLKTVDGPAFRDSEIRSIQIAERNEHFRVSREFLLSFDGRSLILYFGSDLAVRIPREVEVVCEEAFMVHNNVCTLAFESDSQLRRISHRAFRWTYALKSITIPSFVESISGTAFLECGICTIRIAEGNPHFRVLGDFLVQPDGNSLIRYFGKSREVRVLREIESFSSESFRGSAVRIITFENDSQLRRIESRVFYRCWSLRSLCIPPSVVSIDGSALADCEISDIRIGAGNRSFRVSGKFLMDFEGVSIVRYFGRECYVTISCEIERILSESFSCCQWIRGLKFESPSRVVSIGSRVFEKCWMLESISIPASVEIIGEGSFRKCKNLLEVRIEVGSKLRRIEREAFLGCSSLMSVFLPRSLEGKDDLDVSRADGAPLKWYEST
jgi:hypothetical protein